MQINRIVKKDGKIHETTAEVKAPVYNVRIKQELYERLSVLANKEDRSVTNYINRILEESVAKNDLQ